MRNKKYAGIIVGAILIFLVIYVVATYNSLVKKDEMVKKQWAEVQSTYQRRLDLVPNLVNIVKGLSDFEQTTLENIANARSRALAGQSNVISGENYNEQQRLQDSVAAATNRLIVVIEKYPALKGTAAYSGLQTQLEGTERRIKVARNDFNAAIAAYNTAVRSSNTMLVAKIFGFRPKEGFKAATGAEKRVEINF